jgi:hypothetical protein
MFGGARFLLTRPCEHLLPIGIPSPSDDKQKRVGREKGVLSSLASRFMTSLGLGSPQSLHTCAGWCSSATGCASRRKPGWASVCWMCLDIALKPWSPVCRRRFIRRRPCGVITMVRLRERDQELQEGFALPTLFRLRPLTQLRFLRQAGVEKEALFLAESRSTTSSPRFSISLSTIETD